MEGIQKFKIALIGATGAIGREIVEWAASNDKVEEMTLIIRRKLPEWEKESDPKFKYAIKENFDDLSDLKDQLSGYHAFLCTLGT